jgi:hypothetical protein
MATNKRAGAGKKTGAALKHTKPNTKSESEKRCGRQGVGAGRLPPDRDAAIEAWVELTALVLACGSSETALADEFGYDLRTSVENSNLRSRSAGKWKASVASGG